jgi:Cu2+-containing amine oxidase
MPGTVTYAGWTVGWSIPNGWGGGLVINKAQFKDPGTQQARMVLYKGTIPFVLVPYHGGSPIFKDGINNFGAPFTPVVPTSANDHAGPNTPPAGNDNQWSGANPTGAVVVEQEPATLLDPATLVIWAKLQCANYQYVHRWEFKADGSFEVQVGLGGHLWTKTAGISNHVHTFYARLDFDVNGSSNNAVQEFAHPNNNAGSDKWTTIAKEGRQVGDPGTARKWRVVNKAPKANGQLRSYEINIASDMGPENVASTGDLWVLKYDGSQDGAAVTQNDSALDTTYLHAPGGANVDGADVVVWVALRHHHETRQFGEETITLPYEFLGFHCEPRDFLDGTPTKLYATTPPSP